MLTMDQFDPETIPKSDMKEIADQIEAYITNVLGSMIIPDELLGDLEDEFDEGLKRSKELIKRLRNGDRSVFIDD